MTYASLSKEEGGGALFMMGGEISDDYSGLIQDSEGYICTLLRGRAETRWKRVLVD